MSVPAHSGPIVEVRLLRWSLTVQSVWAFGLLAPPRRSRFHPLLFVLFVLV